MNRQFTTSFAALCLVGAAHAKVLHATREPQGHGPSPFKGVGADVSTIIYDDKRFTSRLTPKAVPEFNKSSKMPQVGAKGKKSSKIFQSTTTSSSKRLRQNADNTPLINTLNLRYAGSLWMGNTQSEVDDIIFDTGSSWLVLETVDCSDCTETYDYTGMTTYTETGTDMEVLYGDGTNMQGVTATDTVCLANHPIYCVAGYEWMNAQTTGLADYLNGILGMNADPAALSWYDPNVALSWVQELYNDGVIDAQKFSFAMRHYQDSTNSDSYIDYGTPDTSAMDNSSDLVYIPVYDDPVYGQFWWQNMLNGVRFRPQVAGAIDYAASVAAADAYDTSADEFLAITDTGSSCLVLSSDLYKFVIKKLKTYISSLGHDAYWGYLYHCSADLDNLPTMDIQFEDYWFEVLVADYVIEFGNDICGFCIQSGGDISILGDVFMRNFYTIHDFDGMQQGIAPLADVDTVKVAPVVATTPECAYDDTSCNGFAPLIPENVQFILEVSAASIFFVLLPLVGTYFTYIKADPLPDFDLEDGAGADYGSAEQEFTNGGRLL